MSLQEKGNTFFKEMKYPEAVAAYEEAIKRGPPSVNPGVFLKKDFGHRTVLGGITVAV